MPQNLRVSRASNDNLTSKKTSQIMLNNLTQQLSLSDLNNLASDLFKLKTQACKQYELGNFTEAMSLFDQCL